MAGPTNKIAAVAGGISIALIALTSQHEGLRLKSYRDPVGIWTICNGHTANVKPGQIETRAGCDTLLQHDLEAAQDAVRRNARSPINQGELDAYTDFTYNVGEAAFKRSTLLRKLNSGDHAGACAELTKWVYGNVDGKVVILPGLKSRRAQERSLCEGKQ